MTLLTTSFWVRPSSLARTRSMSSLSAGASMSCGMSTSLTPGSCAPLLRRSLRVAYASFQVRAADLDVDGRGQTQIEHGIDQAAGLEIGGDFRHLLAHRRSHAVHVLVAADRVSSVRLTCTNAVCVAELLV